MQSIIKYILRKKFLYDIKNLDKIKINIGSSKISYPGWISSEIWHFDITDINSFSKIFKLHSIDKLLAEHVIEHINKYQFNCFLSGIKSFLKINASIRVAVPDKFHPSEYIRDLTKPGGLEPGAEDHKEFYSIEIFREIAEMNGYRLKPIEYFDNNGRFCFVNDDWTNGYIRRSMRNYQGRFTSSSEEYEKMLCTTPSHLRKQFLDLKMSYTSLIVDFIKAC